MNRVTSVKISSSIKKNFDNIDMTILTSFEKRSLSKLLTVQEQRDESKRDPGGKVKEAKEGQRQHRRQDLIKYFYQGSTFDKSFDSIGMIEFTTFVKS
jgi:hypothetical protein